MQDKCITYAGQLCKRDIEEYLNKCLIARGFFLSDQKVYCTRIECTEGKENVFCATVEIPYRVKNKTVYRPSIYNFNDYYIDHVENYDFKDYNGCKSADFDWLRFMYQKFGEKYKKDMIYIFFEKEIHK